MQAINTVYPDIEILSLHGPTHASLSNGRRSNNRYEMMRAFSDGLLSACTGNATIIDGSEHTYGYKDASQFAGAATTFHNARRHSRVPEQFDRHARVAFPIFSRLERVLDRRFRQQRLLPCRADNGPARRPRPHR